MKGDKFVGDYYIKFDQVYKKEVEELIKSGATEEEAKQNAPILLRAKEMLIQWESGIGSGRALEKNEWLGV